MKPRLNLEQTTLPNGSVMILHEHDGRHYLSIDGVQTAGPSTRVSESEMAAVACAPFRPVRQPRIWIAGLGVGSVLKGIRTTLLQKRATFFVAEPATQLSGWLREHLDDTSFLDDQGLVMESDPGPDGLLAHHESLHAILLHADTAPQLDKTRQYFDDPRWLTTAYDALLDGGLLAIAAARPVPGLAKKFERCGFTVITHEIDAVPNAKRPRKHFLLLGRKGNYAS